MRHSIFLALFFISTTLVAQKFVRSREPFVAKDGTVYNVGDTIIIASPADFSNEFLYFMQGNKLSSRVRAVYSVSMGNDSRRYDNRNTRYTIKQFRIFEEYGTYAVVDNLFNLMVNIDKGVEENEIFNTDMKGLISDNFPEMFTDSVAFIHYLKR